MSVICDGPMHLSGLSTDSKPKFDFRYNNWRFTETDTGNEYIFNGGLLIWVRTTKSIDTRLKAVEEAVGGEATPTMPATGIYAKLDAKQDLLEFTTVDTNKYLRVNEAGTAIEWAAVAGTDFMINITYSDLKALRDDGKLIPGRRYRITDYECTTVQFDTQAADNQFDIIVFADTENELNEKASACLHDGDTYFANSDLKSWELKYSIDNDVCKYCWAQTTKPTIYAANNYPFIYDTTIVIDEVTYYLWKNQHCFDNLNYEVGTLSDEPIEEDTCYLIDVSEKTIVNDNYSTIAKYVVNDTEGKGVIYYMKDEFNNECSYDFKNIQFKRYYVSDGIGTSKILKTTYTGIKYSDGNVGAPHGCTLSDDYIYVYTFYDRRTDGIVDLSVNGINYYVFGNVIKPYYNISDVHSLFLNNITFEVAINTGGTLSCHSNTFEIGCHDMSFKQRCCENHFGTYCSYNAFDDGCYNNIAEFHFEYNVFGNGCEHNRFGSKCSNNFLNYDSCNNIFRNNCTNNTFDTHSCNSNLFDNYCQYNTIKGGNNKLGISSTNNIITGNYNVLENNCSYNEIDNNSDSNTLGNHCTYNYFKKSSYNKLGNDCGGNCFGSSGSTGSHYNTLGNSCNNNCLGENSKYNTFGNNCIGNILEYGTMTVDQRGTTVTYSDSQNNIFENGVSYVSLYKSDARSSGYVQNIKICSGISGTDSSNLVTIGLPSTDLNSTCQITYRASGSLERNIPDGESNDDSSMTTTELNEILEVLA